MAENDNKTPGPGDESGGDGSSSFVRDFLASLVVFLVALPLCIGIAVACGVPAEKGIITGIVGGIIVGAVAGSPLLVSGPAASLIVLVSAVVVEQGLAALAPIVVLAGVWQALAGFFKLGQWFRAVAPAVITGMLIGIGIIILGSQVHVAIDADPQRKFLSNVIALFPALAQRLAPPWTAENVAPMLIGIATIGSIVGWEKIRPAKLKLVPGQLIALLLVTGAAAALKLPIRYLDISANFFDAVKVVKPADFSIMASVTNIEMSLVFAFVASAATLLTAAAIDQRQTFVQTDYNREMMAQGLGNALAGAIGGLPMTGVIVRSSVNVDAGARTRWSAVMHGVWLLIFVALAPQVLELIPKAALGGILVYTGIKLVNVAALRELYARGRSELAIALVTMGAVVFIDLFEGIILGLAIAIGKLLYTFTHLEVKSEPSKDGKAHHLYLSGSATFLRLPLLAETIEKIPLDRVLHVHIDRLDYIDHACLELISQAKKRRGGSTATGLLINWDELAERHDPGYWMARPGPNSRRSVTLLSVLWQEWRRLYAPRTLEPTEEEERVSAAPAPNWIAANRIRVGVEAKGLRDVLEAAAALLSPAVGVDEDVLTTALEGDHPDECVIIAEGTGLPHAALPELAHVLAAVVTTAKPLDIDGGKVDLFFVLLAPRDRPRDHLVALAHIGRLCHLGANVDALRRAKDDDEAMAILMEMEDLVSAANAPSIHPSSRSLAVIESSGGTADAEQAMLALLEEGNHEAAAARPLRELGPVAELFGGDPNRRVVTVMLEEEAVDGFRRLLSESALVLGCKVKLRIIKMRTVAEDPLPAVEPAS